MNYAIVFRLLGYVMLIEGALLLLPAAASWIYGEWFVLGVFLITAAVSAAIGYALRGIKPVSYTHLSSLNSSITSVLAALLCILIGLVVGFLVLLAINPAHAWGDGFVRILKGGFHDAPYGVGKELANAAPLIMTGLSVAFAFKTGLFNIGAAGQYTLGAYGALYCAIMLKLPWFVCLIVATILGGIWGAIPGFFKAYFNINEVITSIMFNWIGLYLVNELIYQNLSLIHIYSAGRN